MKTLSTTAISKELGITSKELFDKLADLKLIFRQDHKWSLTPKGKDVGGLMISNEKYGEYIAWPEKFNPFSTADNSKAGLINAPKLGEEFSISNQRVNNMLSELGWIEEAIKGWKITPVGKQVGGIQKEHQSGGTYVLWPENILKDPVLLKSFKPTEYLAQEKVIDFSPTNLSANKIEIKYPVTLLKTTDGHLVRSRAELIIDNLLYDYGLRHAYERELTVAETVMSDFYIPASNGGKAVYIEFWGISDNEKYLERKKTKQDIYKKHNLNLIELEDRHLDNLDSYLRKELLKYNINIE